MNAAEVDAPVRLVPRDLRSGWGIDRSGSPRTALTGALFARFHPMGMKGPARVFVTLQDG
jgi:hypothetical protein